MSDLMSQHGEGEVDEFSVEPQDNPKRPDISHLPDAIEYDDCGMARLRVDVGDKLVAEICTVIGGNVYWLITRTGTIKTVDHSDGSFWCWDDERGQNFGGNYRTVKGTHTTYKMLPKNQKVQKRRRKKAGAAPVKTFVPLEQAPAGTQPAVKKRGRGRPPGSKNRPKAVIAAEKKARTAAKAGKKVITRRKRKAK